MIELKNVCKEFAGNVVINDVSLKIESGEFFGLIGLSGAGKSTLLRIINGIETPSSGQVIIDNKHKLGFVFQNFNLVNSLTVEQNIRLALINEELSESDVEEKITEVLKLVGLSSHKDMRPGKLSGGQKQRVGIARALVSDVDILLCDEATSALDPFTANEIIGLLNELNAKLGLTIIFVSHQLEIIREFCDRIAIMDQGKICEIGHTIDIYAEPQTKFSLKLLSNVLGFSKYLARDDVGLITCFEQGQIRDCLNLIIKEDIELLCTYQYATKQGIFAHVFIHKTENVGEYQVRRINE